jgi:hypothetical protein
MNKGKCPHCSGAIDDVRAEKIHVITGTLLLNGVAYSCLHCEGVLSVATDPVALMATLRDVLSGAGPPQRATAP